MILALGLVVGLILFIGVFLGKRQEKTEIIKVLAYQSLGLKKGISAIKIGKEILVIGVTSSDFKLLKTLDESEVEFSTTREIMDRINKLREIKGELLNANK
jgi:flagellar biogenesis protein FliO